MALNSNAGYKPKWFDFFIFYFLLCSTNAFAHTPKPGQIAQHQARRLLASKQAFKQSGSVVSEGKSFKTELRWFGPGSYDLAITELPSSFTGMAGSQGTWRLQRRPGGRCSIQLGIRVAHCGAAQFWAMLELSAQPEQVGASLVRAGIFNNQDTVYNETHSASVIEPEKRRVKLSIGKNGETPKAVMRIASPESAAGSTESSFIDFDQNFLVPLRAQYFHQGVLFKIHAKTELNIDRETPRYSHVLATSISVHQGSDLLAKFNRKELVFDRGLKEDKFVDGVVSLSAGQESLSSDANKLLSAILVTH